MTRRIDLQTQQEHALSSGAGSSMCSVQVRDAFGEALRAVVPRGLGPGIEVARGGKARRARSEGW